MIENSGNTNYPQNAEPSRISNRWVKRWLDQVPEYRRKTRDVHRDREGAHASLKSEVGTCLVGLVDDVMDQSIILWYGDSDYLEVEEMVGNGPMHLIRLISMLLLINWPHLHHLV